MVKDTLRFSLEPQNPKQRLPAMCTEDSGEEKYEKLQCNNNRESPVCRGENNVITRFFNEIQINGVQKGAVIEDIVKEEIPSLIFLPDKFSKLYTDEISDLGRKMDVGNRKLDATIDVLRDIKTDTSVLSSFVTEQREHNEGQREHNQWMKEHNQRLEKILDKLAEK